jgi:hypothetical protein
MGLMFNGLLKVPMQFVILSIGVMVFVFYLFTQPPVFHNQVLKGRAMETEQRDNLQALDEEFNKVYENKRTAVDALVSGIHANDEALIETSRNDVIKFQAEEMVIRDSVRSAIATAIPGAKVQDVDFVFLNFVLSNLPHGVIG